LAEPPRSAPARFCPQVSKRLAGDPEVGTILGARGERRGAPTWSWSAPAWRA
jgi:hypothetical protein